jgi:peptide/nickel transport system permease protein
LGIIFTEILPNLLPYLGVGLAVSMAGAMLAETGLALIGLGPGDISTLGLMINWSIRWGALGLGKWQMVFAPIVTLVLIFVALNFINIGLEQAFNPRLRAVTGA